MVIIHASHPTFSKCVYPFWPSRQNPAALIAIMPSLLSSAIIGFSSSNPLSLQQQWTTKCSLTAFEVQQTCLFLFPKKFYEMSQDINNISSKGLTILTHHIEYKLPHPPILLFKRRTNNLQEEMMKIQINRWGILEFWKEKKHILNMRNMFAKFGHNFKF